MSASCDVHTVLDGFAGRTVTVLGDAILDGYLSGSAQRVCREAPVPVVVVDGERHACGGAANMAANLASMGAHVRFVTLAGNDADGATLTALLGEAGVAEDDIVFDPARATIAKRRLAADGQLLVRFDTGDVAPPGAAIVRELIERLQAAVQASDAIVVSDYGCGVCSAPVLGALGEMRAGLGGPLVVDSVRLRAFRALAPDVVKPSLAEALGELSLEPAPPSDRLGLGEALGDALLEQTGAGTVALTLDEDGALIIARGRPPLHFSARHHETAHPAGAGDTFLAAFTLALSANAPLELAATVAQGAADIVVGREGTSLCSLDDLRGELCRPARDCRICDLDTLAGSVATHRREGRRIVFTNGCFDLLHPGHVALLEHAKRLGDVLVVGVNSDEGVRALKGASRPVNPIDHRLRVLSALSFVDHLVAFEDPTAEKLVEAIAPDVYVKGGDYREADIPEAAAVRRFGGTVEILPYFGSESTSEIIERIRRTPAERVS